MTQDEFLGSNGGRRRRIRRSMSAGNDRDDRGWTMLHVGARRGDLKEYKAQFMGGMRLEEINGSDPLLIVKRLLNEGMDANVAALGPKSHGVTPLHLAAKGGHVKVMDELLERGANIDARTKGACGWTPLHTAAKERDRRAIRFLVENGAFLPDNMEDTRFNPPVHYCPGLEWAYDEMKRVQQESGTSSGEGSYSSES